MPSPFPGMNPYLEATHLWQGVHKRLIVAISDVLNPQLHPQYRVEVEERVYQDVDDESLLVGIPDDVVIRGSRGTANGDWNSDGNGDGNGGYSSVAVALAESPPKPQIVTLPMPETVREWYLKVRYMGTGEVVTVIEILSPKNKRPGKGRQHYEAKRQKILGSLTHLVEIDLLRHGKPMPMSSNGLQRHYRILVSRSHQRPRADLYAFNLPETIPPFPLPLRSQDAEPMVNLQHLLHRVYDLGSHNLAIDYQQPPVPPLAESDVAWTIEVLSHQGVENSGSSLP